MAPLPSTPLLPSISSVSSTPPLSSSFPLPDPRPASSPGFRPEAVQPSTKWQNPHRQPEKDTRTESMFGTGRGLVISSSSIVADLVKRQLGEVDLTDAASMLVLAVATAAAATPAERARAGLFPWPYYFIGTRDSFRHELVPVQSLVSYSIYLSQPVSEHMLLEAFLACMQ